MLQRASSRTIVGLAILVAVTLAQPVDVLGPQVDGIRRFRSGIDLVKVTATVRDASGRLIGDLSRDEFEVFEDGKPQLISQFDRGRVPLYR